MNCCHWLMKILLINVFRSWMLVHGNSSSFFYFSSSNGNFLYLISLKYFSFSSVQHTLIGPLGTQFLQLLILHSGHPSYLCMQQLEIDIRLRFKEISGHICQNSSLKQSAIFSNNLCPTIWKQRLELIDFVSLGCTMQIITCKRLRSWSIKQMHW